MDKKKFVAGMSMGLAAGSAIGMLLASHPHHKAPGRSVVGRCLRSMGEVIEGVSDAWK